MPVHAGDPGYIVLFKTASVNDFSKRVADMKCIDILKIATGLDPQCKNLKGLSNDSNELGYLLDQK